ncbi:MAG: complement resistance protein TraT [Kangiellaceae bacterium]|nr:complement resistance protein TraT [Kangiellaceae bacterium]
MKAAAREQGWAVVTDTTKAKYRVRASLRFFGEVEPDSGGASQARAMGWIAGAAVGVGTARLTNGSTSGWIAGAAAGSLMSAGLSNGSRPREWALIIDFVLEEYSRTPVEFTLSKGSSSSMDSGAGVGNARTSIGGSQNSENTKSGSITQKSNYFPHGVRLSVWSNQMNMKEEESLPHILKRTRKIITKLLPI